MRFARTSAVGLLVALVAVLTVASSAVAGAPRCKGRRATMVGTKRADRIVGTTGRDVIVAKGGADEVVSGPGRDVICGNGGGDLIFSGGADDVLNGGGGNDFLGGGGGNDKKIGGKGRFDFAQYLGGPRVRVNLREGTASGWGRDRLKGVEALGGSDRGDILIGDGKGIDYFFAHRGNDTVRGGGRRDLLLGQQGDDTLKGGRGSDAASYSTSGSGVRASLASGRATGEGRDRLNSIGILEGSRAGDRLTGNDAANGLFGLGGNDTISAAAGDDFLNGDGGTDTLDGGLGIDECRRGENESNCELPLPVPSAAERFMRVTRSARHALPQAVVDTPVR